MSVAISREETRPEFFTNNCSPLDLQYMGDEMQSGGAGYSQSNLMIKS
jgi:hypothetical protein